MTDEVSRPKSMLDSRWQKREGLGPGRIGLDVLEDAEMVRDPIHGARVQASDSANPC